MKMWMVKHRGYTHNWWNFAFTEMTADNQFLFYDVRCFPKKKWAKAYVDLQKLDHMEIVAVEIAER